MQNVDQKPMDSKGQFIYVHNIKNYFIENIMDWSVCKKTRNARGKNLKALAW